MKVITPDELFDRCHEIAVSTGRGADLNMRMREIIVMACAGAAADGAAFGNVFSQVDRLCRAHGVAEADRREVQTARRHANSTEVLPTAELMYDLRAVCVFISAVFGADIPARLTAVIPRERRPHRPNDTVPAMSYIRCVTVGCDAGGITVTTDDDGGHTVRVSYGSVEHGTDMSYLQKLLRPGMQLNLLDCRTAGDVIVPGMIVVEPDYLTDISSVAACFTDYGRHPLTYTVNRMRKKASSQAITLGNLAGDILDGVINDDDFNLDDTFEDFRRHNATVFCGTGDTAPAELRAQARAQAANIKEAVGALFAADMNGRRPPFDISKVVVEPTFVCERLGIQGRVDLMTTDFKLLVEQKSGRNGKIESRAYNAAAPTGLSHLEPHYVQLLLYMGVLRYNFGLTDREVSSFLLYSRYPAADGLLYVNYYRALFNEAMALRNRIVAAELFMARGGVAAVLRHLSVDTLNERRVRNGFFERYIRPQIESVTAPLHAMPPLERAYFERMLTFVYREQLIAKTGGFEEMTRSAADLWNMPTCKKREMGNIITEMRVVENRAADDDGHAVETLTLSFPDQGEDFLPNFRRGDMVYVYACDGEPDVCRSLLHTATVERLGTAGVTVRLVNRQRNTSLFAGKTLAMEHAASDVGASAGIRALHAFVTAPEERRDLLLGQRVPQADNTLVLTRKYHDDYDDVVLAAVRSRDYYLLVGPPGTGKTSMALRFIVEEEIARGTQGVLLAAYTNRAVDEICTMLDGAGIAFLRVSSESSCDERFRDRLFDNAVGGLTSVDEMRTAIRSVPVIVGTTSMLQSRQGVFGLKHFSLAVIDEASQILEPSIVGILSARDDTGMCAIDRFILVGDNKQLPAVVQQDEADSRVTDPALHAIGLTDCRNSLFERLLNMERSRGRKDFIGLLRKQGRMHPDIARFANGMFYADEKLQPVPCPHQTETSLGYKLPSEDATDELLKAHRMIFIPAEDDDAGRLSDKVNATEAAIAADMARRIYRFYGERFDPDRTIGIIVPYRNQIAMIRRYLAECGIAALEKITIDTVERYQGSQRDVIIYSFTVHRRSQLAFLTANSFTENGRVIDRKLNVAVTRARRQMIITGNPALLGENDIFAALMRRCARPAAY